MSTVMIVDDDPGFVSAARRLLTWAGFDVTGVAFDGVSAVARARQMHPDVALVDIQLPDIDGFEVARQLVELDPAPVVVLTSSRDRADYGARIRHAPARGFIGKADLSGDRLAALLS